MVYYDTRIALGTECIISIYTENEDNVIEKLFQELWLKIYKFEQQFSRFIPASELTVFNSNAGKKQKISNLFKNILLESLKYSKLTDGMFNPFILPALEKAGYDHSLLKGFENDSYIKHTSAKIVNYQQLRVDEDTAYIPKGTAIDLGGIAKGFLLDLLANFLSKYKQLYYGFWISLGGDIVTYGYESEQSPIKTYIENDIISKKSYVGFVESVKDKKRAVATSGINYRKGVKNGKKWHHIINPNTGLSAISDISAATVFGSNATFCDVMASCIIIGGSSNFIELSKKLKLEDVLIQGYIGIRSNENYYIKTVGSKIKINI